MPLRSPPSPHPSQLGCYDTYIQRNLEHIPVIYRDHLIQTFDPHWSPPTCTHQKHCFRAYPLPNDCVLLHIISCFIREVGVGLGGSNYVQLQIPKCSKIPRPCSYHRNTIIILIDQATSIKPKTCVYLCELGEPAIIVSLRSVHFFKECRRIRGETNVLLNDFRLLALYL